MTDNPLVFPDNLIVSGGNFRPAAGPGDGSAGLGHPRMGDISERRVFKMLSGSGFLRFGLQPGLNSGYMIPQYTAASLCRTARLCTPSSADNADSSNGRGPRQHGRQRGLADVARARTCGAGARHRSDVRCPGLGPPWRPSCHGACVQELQNAFESTCRSSNDAVVAHSWRLLQQVEEDPAKKPTFATRNPEGHAHSRTQTSRQPFFAGAPSPVAVRCTRLAYDPRACGDAGWQVMCWAVGLLGVVIRAKTIGHVPPAEQTQHLRASCGDPEYRGMYSLCAPALGQLLHVDGLVLRRDVGLCLA